MGIEIYNLINVILFGISIFTNSYLLWMAMNQHLIKPKIRISTGCTYGNNDNRKKLIFNISNAATTDINMTGFSIVMPKFGEALFMKSIMESFERIVSKFSYNHYWINYDDFVKIFIDDESRIEYLNKNKKIEVQICFSNGVETKQKIPKYIIQDILQEHQSTKKEPK